MTPFFLAGRQGRVALGQHPREYLRASLVMAHRRNLAHEGSQTPVTRPPDGRQLADVALPFGFEHTGNPPEPQFEPADGPRRRAGGGARARRGTPRPL